MAPSRLFFSCVEPSADLHASHVLASLRGMSPDTVFSAAGGDFLRRAGAEIVIDMRGHAVMGAVEVLRHLPFFKRTAARTLDYVEREAPDGVVLVDAPSYHMRLGRALRRRHPDLPILYYVAPKAWAWKPGRARKLARFVTRLLCIFPFEEEWFASRGVASTYVGNPTLDELRPVIARREARLSGFVGERDAAQGNPWRAPATRTIAVFPGSRAGEVGRLWPVFVEAMGLLRRRFDDLVFTVALAPEVEAPYLRSLAQPPERTAFVAPGESLSLLASCDFVLAKSGTTTLEAALMGVPMVAAYVMHPITAFMAKAIVSRHSRFFTLPNILAGREIIPELFQGEVTARRLADEATALLGDEARYRRMQCELLTLRGQFGDALAGERTAEEILRVLEAAGERS